MKAFDIGHLPKVTHYWRLYGMRRLHDQLAYSDDPSMIIKEHANYAHDALNQAYLALNSMALKGAAGYGLIQNPQECNAAHNQIDPPLSLIYKVMPFLEHLKEQYAYQISNARPDDYKKRGLYAADSYLKSLHFTVATALQVLAARPRNEKYEIQSDSPSIIAIMMKNESRISSLPVFKDDEFTAFQKLVINAEDEEIRQSALAAGGPLYKGDMKMLLEPTRVQMQTLQHTVSNLQRSIQILVQQQQRQNTSPSFQPPHPPPHPCSSPISPTFSMPSHSTTQHSPPTALSQTHQVHSERVPSPQNTPTSTFSAPTTPSPFAPCHSPRTARPQTHEATYQQEPPPPNTPTRTSTPAPPLDRTFPPPPLSAPFRKRKSRTQVAPTVKSGQRSMLPLQLHKSAASLWDEYTLPSNDISSLRELESQGKHWRGYNGGANQWDQRKLLYMVVNHWIEAGKTKEEAVYQLQTMLDAMPIKRKSRGPNWSDTVIKCRAIRSRTSPDAIPEFKPLPPPSTPPPLPQQNQAFTFTEPIHNTTIRHNTKCHATRNLSHQFVAFDPRNLNRSMAPTGFMTAPPLHGTHAPTIRRTTPPTAYNDPTSIPFHIPWRP